MVKFSRGISVCWSNTEHCLKFWDCLNYSFSQSGPSAPAHLLSSPSLLRLSTWSIENIPNQTLDSEDMNPRWRKRGARRGEACVAEPRSLLPDRAENRHISLCKTRNSWKNLAALLFTVAGSQGITPLASDSYICKFRISLPYLAAMKAGAVAKLCAKIVWNVGKWGIFDDYPTTREVSGWRVILKVQSHNSLRAYATLQCDLNRRLPCSRVAIFHEKMLENSCELFHEIPENVMRKIMVFAFRCTLVRFAYPAPVNMFHISRSFVELCKIFHGN